MLTQSQCQQREFTTFGVVYYERERETWREARTPGGVTDDSEMSRNSERENFVANTQSRVVKYGRTSSRGREDSQRDNVLVRGRRKGANEPCRDKGKRAQGYAQRTKFSPSRLPVSSAFQSATLQDDAAAPAPASERVMTREDFILWHQILIPLPWKILTSENRILLAIEFTVNASHKTAPRRSIIKCESPF